MKERPMTKVLEMSLLILSTGLVLSAGLMSAQVVTFIATECPVSNSYNRRMIDVYRDYSSKNVKFVFVNANRSEPAGEVRDHARRVGFPFAVYKDPDNVLADRFDAQVTPESFVIDRAGVIRYHGSIDDSM